MVVKKWPCNKTYSGLTKVKMMGTGNVILDVAERHGEQRGTERTKEEIARKMLLDNLDVLDIIRYTGIDVDKLYELRESMRAEVIHDEAV